MLRLSKHAGKGLYAHPSTGLSVTPLLKQKKPANWRAFFAYISFALPALVF
jgi:hypothetical protein